MHLIVTIVDEKTMVILLIPYQHSTRPWWILVLDEVLNLLNCLYMCTLVTSTICYSWSLGMNLSLMTKTSRIRRSHLPHLRQIMFLRLSTMAALLRVPYRISLGASVTHTLAGNKYNLHSPKAFTNKTILNRVDKHLIDLIAVLIAMTVIMWYYVVFCFLPSLNTLTEFLVELSAPSSWI